MTAEQNVRHILLQEFLDKQGRNPQFSMRAFSRKIGVPQSAISEILSGKRKITMKMASKILSGLDVSPDIIQKIEKELKGGVPSDRVYRPLDIDTFHLISDWHYFALLSLAETKGFQCEASWISQRLNISITKATDAMERMLRLGLLEQTEEGAKATGIQYQVDPGIATPALKKAQRQNLEIATTALETTEFEERDFTAITLCFDPDRMSEAKALIKEFRKRFSDIMESGEKKEVYKLCVQLFPLTNKDIQ